jgi:hypothetical protein
VFLSHTVLLAISLIFASHACLPTPLQLACILSQLLEGNFSAAALTCCQLDHLPSGDVQRIQSAKLDAIAGEVQLTHIARGANAQHHHA